MGTKVRSLVTGAGGFIGNHLVSHLRAQGYWVRGVDLKPPEFCASDANEFELLDLRRWEDCLRATSDIDEVYALAADPGEMGCSAADQSRISHDNYLINLHCIEAARHNRVTRYLYASSTAVYSPYQHGSLDDVHRDGTDEYPLMHQDAYGWANLMIEPLCIRYRRDYGLETRIVRVDDVFGPVGSWYDGREKAPTALCRKIAAAQLEGLHEIEVSGAGEQTGSFCYIDDCVAGLYTVMRSECPEPLNLPQGQIVSINELADIIANIAGIHLHKTYLPGSQGLRARICDNNRLKEVLRWEPQISLDEGLRRTYLWVEKQVREIASEYSFGVATLPLPPLSKNHKLSVMPNPRAHKND